MTAPTAPPVRKLGPGLLTLGSAGDLVDIAKRCTSAAVKWSVKTEDDVPVLSGAVEAGDRTYTATFEATVYQDDLRDGELTRFTWEQKGKLLPISYTPFADGAAITGDVVVDPLDVGGEVGKKNTSDIKWGFLGEPELADDLA